MCQKTDHILFVHGAWAGAWVWEPLIKELKTLGFTASALELPGNGFHNISLAEVTESDLHQAVDQAIDQISGKVVLVGHSGGGMLVTAAANRHPDKVISAIWIAGMLLPNGENFSDLQKELAQSEKDFGITPHVKPTQDQLGTIVTPELAAKFFLNDMADDQALELSKRLTPQPNIARRILTKTDSDFNKIPKLYIQAKDDQSVVYKFQAHMCRNIPNLDIVTLESGHCPHISQTKHVAQIFKTWLSA